MKFLASPLLARVPGLVHGFGLRFPGTRAAAREAAQAALVDSGEVFFLRQVHGCEVATPPWKEPPDADASITGQPGTLLAIETADCLPVLIVDPVRRQVAAAHAGWRGTVARVAQSAVRAMVDAGSNAADLLVALGPSIGPCCYEVGPEVEAAFGPWGAGFFVAGADRKH
ncbi:MAG TPA: polyphenol oxidase family protein, partial [Vicinamibacteria bacterium]|nr:polyphenol oxidase family protein [Vicinamibacteria bacterium]